MFLPRRILEEKLRTMLAEDVGQGDITTGLIIPPGSTADAKVTVKEDGVMAGIEEARALLESLGLKIEAFATDGEKIRANQTLMKISGNTQTILSVERTLLNILSRMSGIATTTRKMIEKLRKAGLKTKVACTRKTAPGLLYFDKKAVLIGGGDTHRLHLDDMILIKDNHVVVAGSIKKAVGKVRQQTSMSKKVEVEVARVEDAIVAAEAGADIIMLDNFSPQKIEKAVQLLKRKKLHGKVLLEASGGITAKNIVTFAAKGVDIVSLGEITQSPRALDISLEVMGKREIRSKA
jgi:nicotinate-nucleotide pyrophosphorylase (carboxylating)